MKQMYKTVFLFLVAVTLSGLVFTEDAHAVARTWDGGGSDGTCGGAAGDGNKWSCNLNWSGDTVPGASDTVTFDATSTKDTNWDTAGPAQVSTVTVAATYSGNFSITRSSVTPISGWSWAGTGSFSAGTSTLIMNSVANFAPGGASYYNITYATGGSSNLNTTGTATVLGNLSVSGVGSTGGMLGGTFNVFGDISCSNLVGANSATIRIVGSASQSLTVTTNCLMGTVVIDKPSGTFSLGGSLSIGTAWTYTSGTINMQGSTLNFGGDSIFTGGSAQTYGAVTFSSVGSSTQTVSGTTTVTDVGFSGTRGTQVNGGTLNVLGNITTSAGASGSAGTLSMNIVGTGAQSLSSTSGYLPSGTITINKPSGTLSMSGTLNLRGGNWTWTRGSLDAGTSAIILSSSFGTFTSIASAMYYDFTVNKGYLQVTGFSGTTSIGHTLTIANAYQYIQTGTIDVYGDIVLTGSGAVHSDSTSVIRIVGSGDQTLAPPASINNLDNVIINKPGGTLFLVGTISISGDWTWIKGSLNAGTSTLAFVYDSGVTFTPGPVEYYNIEDGKQYLLTLTVVGTAIVKNNLVFSVAQHFVNGGNFDVHGNVSTTGSGNLKDESTNVIRIVGSGDQNISTTAGGQLANIIVNKPSGTLSLGTNVNIATTWQWLAGKVNAGSSTLNLNGATTFTPGASVSYYNVSLINITNAGTRTLAGNLTVTNDLTINANSGTLATGNYPITTKNLTLTLGALSAGSSIIKISGNYTRTSGTFTAGTSTVVLNGTNQTISGATTFYNLYKLLPANTTDTLTFTHTTTYTIATGGTARFIGTRGYPLSIQSSSAGTAFTITKTGSVVAEYVSLKDSTISTSTSAVASTNVSGNTNWVFTKEFVSTIRATGGDYTTLSGWESALGTVDLTSAATRVFSHGGITGTIADNSSVTGATSGATGTVVHATSTQILIKSIVGTFQSGEQIRVDVSNYVTSSDAGNGVIAVAECYNDWPNALNDTVNISGQATDADNFIMVIAPDGQSHDGKLKDTASGYYRGFTLNPSTQSVPFTNNGSYTRIIGIAADGTGGFSNDNFILGGSDNLANRCLSANSSRIGIYSAANSKVVNSIVYGSISYGINFDFPSVGAVSYNNTLQGNGSYGLYNYSGGNYVLVKNTLASGNTTADFHSGLSTMTISYSASSDGTADDFSGTTGDRVSQTFTFKDAANKDFRLADNDAGAKDFGIDLSTDAIYPIVDDIEYGTRPDRNLINPSAALWDIGADEMDQQYKRLKDGVRIK